MTAGAVLVAGKAGPRGIIIPMMTTRARSPGMTWTGVQEFRVVEVVSLRVSHGIRKKQKGKSKKEKPKQRNHYM